jgi:hypothetical protein
MRYLVLVALAALSCNPGKQLHKAEVRLAQAGRLPAICGERYPTKTDTTFVSDTLVKIDTFLSGEYIFDTIRVNDTVIDIQYKPLEIIKVKTLTKYVSVENTAQIRVLSASVSQLEANRADLIKELGEYKEKAKTRLNWLILVLCVIFGWSIRKPLMAIIKWNLKIS